MPTSRRLRGVKGTGISTAPAPLERPAGLRVLVPGYPQWMWRQTERAAALGGTFAAAILVAMFAWGSRMGMAMLALAFLAHVSSAADAIRQGAFPGFGRWVPTVSASVGLGLGCYAPALAMASVLAWTEGPAGAEHERYAINLWAFRSSEPQSGDWVWYRSPEGPGYGLGRVVAGPGKNVEWSGEALTVDGLALDWKPRAPEGAPMDLALAVPEGQFLVAPTSVNPARSTSAGLRLVPRDGVIGRPWARLYPVWTRRFLY
jgi:hypothetical protein